MIGIIDYGSGNIYAIGNIYKRLNIPYVISNDRDTLSKADKLILPGVGAFDVTMQALIDLSLKDFLDDLVLDQKRQILGVCVGMQIMSNKSDEGDMPGLGWINGVVRKFDVTKLNHKPHLPHMGWNEIKPTVQHPLFNEVDTKNGFYFLHSYYFDCESSDHILSTTDYGITYSSAIHRENVYGMQFHPEKSHSNGILLLKNYATLN